jgi:glycosyltransferase involved in cell wall biosynthesis
MAMVHDLIPIDHPEFCSPHAAVLHKRRVDALYRHASLIITNSQATADACEAYAAATGARCPPTCVSPLGLEASFLETTVRAPSEPAPSTRPYFVCVGTLEPRKNLTFLLTVWRRLAERMGEHTPVLVLVGQRGWENEAIIDQLERAPAVLRHVHEANGLDDRQLVQLIRGARALLAPSFTEGFDLPVAEAIALGAPVIASDIPVHRELAAGAQLIDPVDGLGWLSAIEQAARIRPAPGPIRRPGWADHFERVAEAMGLTPASKPQAHRDVRELDETDQRLPRDASCYSTSA